jgi:hypothetical protein
MARHYLRDHPPSMRALAAYQRRHPFQAYPEPVRAKWYHQVMAALLTLSAVKAGWSLVSQLGPRIFDLTASIFGTQATRQVLRQEALKERKRRIGRTHFKKNPALLGLDDKEVLKTQELPVLQSGGSLLPSDSQTYPLIRNNQTMVEMKASDGKWYPLGNILFIRSEIALVPRHFEANLKDHEATEVLFTSIGGAPERLTSKSFCSSMDVSVGVNGQSDDLRVVQFKGVRRRTDITAHILDWDPGDISRANCADILRLRRVSKLVEAERLNAAPLRHEARVPISGAVDQYDMLVMPLDLGYSACGSVLLRSALKGGQVLGMYVAGGGTSKIGAFRAIRRSQVCLALQNVCPSVDSVKESKPWVDVAAGASLPAFQAGGFLRRLPPEFEVVGPAVVGSRHVPVYSPSSTKLARTGLEQFLGPGPHLPAKLEADNLYQALQDYVSPRMSYADSDRRLLTRASFEIYAELESYVPYGYQKRLLGLEESILGVLDYDLKPVDSRTSLGFPYTQLGYRKSDLLDPAHPHGVGFRSHVVSIISQIHEHRLYVPVFAVFLKDELRSIEKVEAGKSRLIHPAPLDLMVLYRMYFGCFDTAILSGCPHNGIALRTNPHGDDWRVIYERHSSSQGLDTPVFAGDYEGFDKCDREFFMLKHAQAANEWYHDSAENQLVRVSIMSSVANCQIAVGPNIARWVCGMPSGFPGTSVVNSVTNLTLLRAAFLSLAPGHSPRYVATVTGDDNVITPFPQVSQLFNQNTIVEPLARFGYKYTPETKGDTAPDLRPLSEVEFLKRRFAFGVNGLVVAPLRVESILKSVLWTKAGDDMAILTLNIENALVELSKHEPSVWDNLAPTIRDGFRDLTGITLYPVEGRQLFWLERSRDLDAPEWTL